MPKRVCVLTITCENDTQPENIDVTFACAFEPTLADGEDSVVAGLAVQFIETIQLANQITDAELRRAEGDL